MAYSTHTAKPNKVALLGATGNFGRGILARAEELGVQVVAVTRSPHKFKNIKETTTVVEVSLSDEKGLAKAFEGCDGVISSLSVDCKKTYLPIIWRAMKQAGIFKFVGVSGTALILEGESPTIAQRLVRFFLPIFIKNSMVYSWFEYNSLVDGTNDGDDLDFVVVRAFYPNKNKFKGAGVTKDHPLSSRTSIYDLGDFCLYAVAEDTSPDSQFVANLGRAPIVAGTVKS